MMEKLSDYYIEKYAAGKMKGDEKDRFESLLASNEDAQKKLKSIKDSDSALFNRLSPSALREEVLRRRDLEMIQNESGENKVGQALPQFYKLAFYTLLLALLISLPAYFLSDRQTTPSDPWKVAKDDTQNTSRIKGGTSFINIYKKSSSGEELLLEGEAVKSGDVLQLSYVSSQDAFGMIISIDGNRQTTLHFPEAGENGTLILGQETPLSYSYVLDDAPSFEVFYFISSSEKINKEIILQKAEKLAEQISMENVLDFPVGSDEHLQVYKKVLLK